ncbi:uncharacterized protein PRCAT00005093001 [Priceomyces carsonii]|uniref:uncharacterized protein n=1 Tax=Priceomyces carsonii TaxID=28549 RepID=UPI002EDA2F75|nr:unnamed protein product [Priceomyces carsonii]
MTTITETSNSSQAGLLLRTDTRERPNREVFKLAQDYGLPSDPNRMEAANVQGWNYGRGNPPNPIAGVVDMSLRPNNATGFVFNTFIYVMFRGVSVIYVSKIS